MMHGMRQQADSGWGQRITARREELGMSAVELANAVGLHVTVIYKYEAEAITDPKRSVMLAIAFALDIDPCFLFFADTCKGAA